MISFNCVQCGKKFLTPEHLAGRQGKCPRCGTLYTIPSADAPIEEPSPSGATGEFVAAHEPREEPPEPEEPRIHFSCEECGRKFAVSVGLAGNAGTCPDCGTMFLVPPYSEGEVPPPLPLPPPSPPRPAATEPAPQVTEPTAAVSEPSASMPVVLASAPSEPQTTSKPTTTMPAPQFRSGVASQGTSKPTATLPAVAAPSSLVEVRTDRPILSSPVKPSGGGGAKGLVAALFLCVIAAGGAFWAWKTVTPSAGGNSSVAGSNDPSTMPTPAPPPSKPKPPPVTYTAPPPEDPVLIPPPDEGAPPEYEDPHYVEPTPPAPVDPSQPPTPIDPETLAPPVPDAAQVAAAIAEFERQRGYVKDCPDAVQQARALDALSCVVVDARAIEILGKILASPSELPLVRKKAAEMLGDSRSTEAVPPLSDGFEACRADPEVARAAIVSLGRIDCVATVKALSTVMRSWTNPMDEDRDHMYASVAVISLSQMQARPNECVDALLGFWAGLVAARPADTSRLSDVEWKHESHRAELETSTQTSLSVLTGQAFASYEEWKAWWAEKRGTLK